MFSFLHPPPTCSPYHKHFCLSLSFIFDVIKSTGLIFINGNQSDVYLWLKVDVGGEKIVMELERMHEKGGTNGGEKATNGVMC